MERQKQSHEIAHKRKTYKNDRPKQTYYNYNTKKCCLYQLLERTFKIYCRRR